MNNDHSRCDPSECLARREMDAAEAQQELEDRLNDEEHRRIVAAARGDEDDKMVQAYQNDRKAKLGIQVRDSASHLGPAELRALRVQSLEDALLEARAAQAANGDDMGSLQDLRNVIGDALRLAAHKNKTYRNAWERQGYMGNLSRIMSKTARLEAILWRDAEVGPPTVEDDISDETIRDTLLDLINLAGFMMLNWEGGNRWGGQ